MSLADLVAEVASDVAGELGTDEQLRQIQAVAAKFSTQSSDLIGFECRLGRGRGPVDFMFRLRGSASPLGEGLPSEVSAQPAWRRVCRFTTRGTDPESNQYERLRDVWLEFDLAEYGSSWPVPSVFFQMDAVFAQTPEGVGLLAGHVEALRGTEMDEATGKRLRGCLEHLPVGSHTVMVGVMLPRRTDALRLCVQGVRAAGVASYLTTVGWSGPCHRLLETLDALAPHVDCLTLDLDLADVVHSRVGLEYMFENRLEWTDASSWEPALRVLEELGLCRPGLRPELLRFASDGAGAGVRRRLNHVKVVHEPGREPEAKCYLFAQRTEG